MMDEHGGNIHKIARQLEINKKDIIDFSSNINPLGPLEGLRNSIINGLDEIVNYLRLTGQFKDAANEVKKRKVTVDAAKKVGIKASYANLQKKVDTFRIANKLYTSLDTYQWLESISISVETLLKHLEEDLLISEYKDLLYKKYLSGESGA